MARGPRKGQTLFLLVGEQAYLRPSFSPCGNAESTAQGIELLDAVFMIRE